MAEHVLPDDFVLEVVKVFRSGDRKNDPAAAVAEQALLTKASASCETLEKARAILLDDVAIAEFVNEVRDDLHGNAKEVSKEFENQVRILLSQIAGTTEQSLAGQGVIRSEFTTLLKGMQSGFHDLIGTMHSDSTKLFADMRFRQEAIAEATKKNLEAAEKIQSATANVERATAEIREEIPKIAAHSKVAALGTTRRAAIATAFIVSPIAVITGFAGNKFTTWWDRSGNPSQNPQPFELHLQITQKDVKPSIDIKALQSGQTVTIPLNLQKVQINIEPPVINQNIAVQAVPINKSAPGRHRLNRHKPPGGLHR